MRRSATLTNRGRITIPNDVRRQLGLRKGDRVEFDVDDGTAILRPAPTGLDHSTAYAGALGVLPDEAAGAAWLSDQRDEP
jgi:AbrB family looped-hinge helix DNA binding protein